MKNETYIKTGTKKTSYVIRRVDSLDSVYCAVIFNFLEKKLSYIEFHSKLRGIVQYIVSEKKLIGNMWESEEEAKSVSHLNYHYTAFVLNESSSDSVNKNTMEIVLKELNEPVISEIVENLLSGLEQEKKILHYFTEK